MKFIETQIKDLFIIENDKHNDNRGQFIKTYNEIDFQDKKISVKEIFYSHSVKNVIRGMHFQTSPKQQTKIVSVVKGEILDVVLDMRPQSKTFGQYFETILSDSNNLSLYAPKDFAHGFLVLSEYATVLYASDNEFDYEYDSGVRYDSFGYDWKVLNPIISDKDRSLRNFE